MCRCFPRLAEQAFRRPLTPAQKRLYVDHQFETAPDIDTAVKRVVLLVLKAPWFLYREIDPAPGDKTAASYDVAARMAFSLWDSLPDKELCKAAADGQLHTPRQVGLQLDRMLRDPRCHAKIRDFFLYWLKVERAGELAKDAQAFPGFNQATGSDLRTSLELFLDEIIWSEKSDFRQLLLADHLFLNGRLGPLYGAALPADAMFQKVSFKPSERLRRVDPSLFDGNVRLSQGELADSSGRLSARNVLGLPLRPPAEAFIPLPAEAHPDLTTRQRVALQTQAQACQTCHSIINPLGFSFERVRRHRPPTRHRKRPTHRCLRRLCHP